MTYSLHTFNAPRAGNSAPVRSGVARFADELTLVFGFIALALWLLSLSSFSLQDAAWSTSGTGEPLVNRAGSLGAWLADGSYFLLGFSVWWCVAAALRLWLSTLARWLRGRDKLAADETAAATVPLSRWFSQRLRFWFGLVLLVTASAVLEWTRFYSLEARLPGHGGGIVGYFLGPLTVQTLGFAGSGLLAIVAGVVGSSLVFGFSWGQLSERLGGWLFARMSRR